VDVPMKTVFTTGEAAKICRVSQQTIIRCFDQGRLKGFRVPGSRFRRIPRRHLLAFMLEVGIPTDTLAPLSAEECAEIARKVAGEAPQVVQGTIKLTTADRLSG